MVTCTRSLLYVGAGAFLVGTGISYVFQHTLGEAAIKSSMLFGQYCQQLPTDTIIPQLGNSTCKALEVARDNENLNSLISWAAANIGLFCSGMALMSAWNAKPLNERIEHLTGKRIGEHAPLMAS